MNKQRIVIIIACAIGMLCTFLPWYSHSIFGNTSGYSMIAGWVTFILFGISLILASVGKRSNYLTGFKLWICIIPSALSTLFAILFANYLPELFKNKRVLSTDWEHGTVTNLTFSVGIEYGLFILVLAGFVVVFLPFVLKGKKEIATSMEDSEDSKENDEENKNQPITQVLP